ncbi:MAG: hypothetical protein E7296_08410 [Lachnospiraceae bacterium]|nr:hypothetical protein [Lachnospiraceae bacterium]
MLESVKRNEILTTNGQGLDLILKGSELWAEINTIYDEFEPWLAIEINEEIVSRFAPVKGKSLICLYKGKNKEISTRVKLYRETQAMFADRVNSVTIKRLLTDGEVKDYDSYEYTFEFIGDSITSGEGTYGALNDMEWVPYVMSFSRAYPNLVSRKFNARCHVISQGGWGVYAAWDKNKDNVIPRLYDEFHNMAKTSESTDAVIINLGTNDSASLPEEREGFMEAVVRFLTKVRESNPKAYIVWAYGMADYKAEDAIKEAVETYKGQKGDERVSYLRLYSVNEETMGSRSHPGAKCHRQAAETLINFLGKYLKI